MNKAAFFLQKFKIIIFALVLLGIFFAGKNIVTNYFLFSVTSVTPENLSTASTNLSFEFSKELEGSSVNDDNVIIEPGGTDYVIKHEGKKINIFFREPFQSDTNVVISLNNIQSVSGDSLSKVYEFIVAYKPAGSLSEEEIRQNTARSNSFEADFPIIKILPIIDPDFEISFQFPNSDMTKLPLIIKSKTTAPRPLTLYGEEVPLDDPDPDVKRYIKEVKQNRIEALDYLKILDEYDPEKYELYFAEPVFLDEFSGKYVDDL